MLTPMQHSGNLSLPKTLPMAFRLNSRTCPTQFPFCQRFFSHLFTVDAWQPLPITVSLTRWALSCFVLFFFLILTHRRLRNLVAVSMRTFSFRFMLLGLAMAMQHALVHYVCVLPASFPSCYTFYCVLLVCASLSMRPLMHCAVPWAMQLVDYPVRPQSTLACMPSIFSLVLVLFC